MEYKEVKMHYESGQLYGHYFEDESGNRSGEYRSYHWNGKIWRNCLYLRGCTYGDIKQFNSDGTIEAHCMMDGKGNMLAFVTEEQLIQIAKEHGLPLLSELPKTEEEVTHWNLKWPDLPCLPIES